MLSVLVYLLFDFLLLLRRHPHFVAPLSSPFFSLLLLFAVMSAVLWCLLDFAFFCCVLCFLFLCVALYVFGVCFIV